jgi:hypothetical protein
LLEARGNHVSAYPFLAASSCRYPLCTCSIHLHPQFSARDSLIDILHRPRRATNAPSANQTPSNAPTPLVTVPSSTPHVCLPTYPSNRLPLALNPNLSAPVECCPRSKPISPTSPPPLSALYLRSASRKCSAVNGPRLTSFLFAAQSCSSLVVSTEAAPRALWSTVWDSADAASHCVWILRARSINSPAKTFVTDFTAITTLLGTDCESV